MNAKMPDEKTIFVVACRIEDADARENYLSQMCAENEPLRNRVQKLLRMHEEEPDFLDDSPVCAVATMGVPGPPLIGAQIGPYKLREQIGEGGMGVVFVAEQSKPVKRKVALKLIKPGMDSRQVVARFEVERQALAMMEHPNIAKVLDAGTTGGEPRFKGQEPNTEPTSSLALDSRPSALDYSSGRPYFVMELVQGLPITEYCDQCNLTTRERLELFITVCRAVQHAHQKGVIHRDIKPTNVLIAMQDGQPAAKIIDFGVAKAIGQRLTEHKLTTAFAQMIGTPLYMSPEQAELSPLGVDTRSDIYSLGVLLYELLTSVTPFDQDRVHSASYDELRRIIREEEPPRPSARLSTLAANLATTIAEQRRTDTRRLRQTVRGELDWIVMKCLEKDRSRRYETADSLARDIGRFLNDEPVDACPPSPTYRLKKMLRRNRMMAFTFLAVTGTLLAGLLATYWQTILATRSRDRAIAAEDRAAEAEERAELSLGRALDAVDKMLAQVGDESLRNIPHVEAVRRRLLEDAVHLYSQFLSDAPDDPRVRFESATTQRRLAELFQSLGRTSLAESSINQSIELLRENLVQTPDDDELRLEFARSQLLAGSILNQMEPIEQAVAILRQLSSHKTPNRDAAMELAFALSRVGSRSDNRGLSAQAAQTYVEAEELFKNLLSDRLQDHELRRAYAKHLANHGKFLGQIGDCKGEVTKLDEAVETAQALVKSEQDAENLHILATALLNRGWAKVQQEAAQSLGQPGADPHPSDYTDADRDLHQAEDLLRRLVRDYPDVPLYRERLVGALMNQMRPDLGQEVVAERGDEALRILEALVEDYPTVEAYRHMYGGALSNVANLLAVNGVQLARAERLAREAVQQQKRVLATNGEHPEANKYLLNHYVVLAEILTKQGDRPTQVVEACSDGLQIALRIRQKYPNNQFIAFSADRLQSLISDAKQEIAGEAADRANVD